MVKMCLGSSLYVSAYIINNRVEKPIAFYFVKKVYFVEFIFHSCVEKEYLDSQLELRYRLLNVSILLFGYFLNLVW